MSARSINLISTHGFDKSPVGRLLRWSLTYGRYIIISTEIIVLLAFLMRFSLDRTLTDLNEAIDQKAAIVQANVGFEQRFRNLQERTNQIGTLFTDQGALNTILGHLESITPHGVFYTSLVFDANLITIKATAASSDSFALFLYQIKKSSFLSKPTVLNLVKNTTNNGAVDFQVQAQVLVK